MYLGIDLGTSGLKAALVDDDQRVIAAATVAMTVDHPRPFWSEQAPSSWWSATTQAIGDLRRGAGWAFSQVRAIGLSGQMHGAILLDARRRVLRPAILWNDGRSAVECGELEARQPRLRELTGNAALPGFTAPTLLWLARHEPEIVTAAAHVLLPKDWLRLQLSGELASEPSDASGTLWFDVRRRRWSEEMLETCGLPRDAMPPIRESTEPTGTLRRDLADEWGLSPATIIAGGGGDNAAAAAGAGVVRPGEALLSLGTSGTLFTVTERFAPAPEGAVHSFCHCVPGVWHQMTVLLSAASALTWLASVTGARDETALLDELESAGKGSASVVFLPHLSGERLPPGQPRSTGVFLGLTHSTRRADLSRAVLEGVAYAFAEGTSSMRTPPREITVAGGGSASALWLGILASALGQRLLVPANAEMGAAFGAARLARIATTGERVEDVCSTPPVVREVAPSEELSERCRRGLEVYLKLRAPARSLFADASVLAGETS